MQQYFVDKDNDNFILKEEDLYHLKTVLRKKNDEILCIYNDKRYLCKFILDKENYHIDIIHEVKSNNELPIDVTLYQSLIKNENFDLVLQKSVELGVKTIVPLILERNVVKIESNKLENKLTRYKTIVKNASEQSHRNVIPEVLAPTPIKDIVLQENEIGLVCYEKDENTKSIPQIKDKIKNAQNVKVIIGPEGGITEKEYKALLDKGFYSISLGNRILRSETASMNILSILGYLIEIED